MSWAFPKHAFNDGDIVDSDKLNATIAAYAWEAARLDSTNWGSDTMTALKTAEQVAETVSCNLFGVRNPDVGGVDPFSTGGDEIALAFSQAWTRVAGTVKTFTSRGGMGLVLASFQLDNNDTVAQPGLQFCIGLDDEPRLESMIGSAEMTNNVTRKPAVRYPYPRSTAADQVTPPAAETATNASYIGTGPALKVAQAGFCLHLLAYLAPGYHTVDLKSRMTYVGTNAATQEVSQLTLVVADFWCDPTRGG